MSDDDAAAPHHAVLALPLTSIPEAIGDRYSMTSGVESAVTLEDIWRVIWTESIPLVDGNLQVTGFVDAHHQSGAVLFAVDSAEGPIPLGLHATRFGGRGVEEKIYRLVFSPDRTLVFVLIAETCMSRGDPDFMGGEPQTGYPAFVASTRDVRRVTGVTHLIAPQLASEVFVEGSTDHVIEGCQGRRQTTYRIDFEHAALTPIATRRCR